MKSAANGRPPPGQELLDDPCADPRLVEISLRNVMRSNRWFGGRAAVRFGLARLLARPGLPRKLTLLDVGTGLGDLPRAAREWGKRLGFGITPVGIDRLPVAARIATEYGVPTAVAAASSLPFGPRSVDLILLSQFLHHLADEEAVAILQEADRIARHGVVVADLRRSALARAGFSFGSRLLRFDSNTRADGMMSVRRGYLPVELRALLKEARITATVWRRPGYRLVAVWHPAA